MVKYGALGGAPPPIPCCPKNADRQNPAFPVRGFVFLARRGAEVRDSLQGEQHRGAPDGERRGDKHEVGPILVKHWKDFKLPIASLLCESNREAGSRLRRLARGLKLIFDAERLPACTTASSRAPDASRSALMHWPHGADHLLEMPDDCIAGRGIVLGCRRHI
jgi:hypothetical protein